MPTPYFSSRFVLPCLLSGMLSLCALSLSGCRSEDPGARPAVAAKLSPAAAIGAKVFHDPSLSASGQMSCATCHAAANGHASPFGTAIALGGPNTDQPGTRLSPTLRYLRFNTAFSFQAGDTPGAPPGGTPTGGFTWDGRANSLAEQAKLPFLSANEMANPSIEALIAKLAAAPYANEFKAAYGADIFSTPARAFEHLVMTLERFQIEDPAFAPFDSKFDAYTAGKVALSAAEERGLALFNNAEKGNCAACHSSAKPDKNGPPGALFTDFTYDALGVARNASIPANADPAYFDQGLCGPARTDLKARPDLCGKFKVPTLRNVALRQRFFHNGQIDTLEQAVRFYVTRDTDPAAWYPKDKQGKPIAFNDLPPARRANVNRTETPYHAKRGDPASLTEAEVQDVVAFLRTLNDGFVP